MQNRTSTHARFPTRGQLIDFFIKALEIENVNNADRKRYQRFVKEYEITTEEYNETLDIYMDRILEELAIESAKMSSAKKTVEEYLTRYLELVQKVEIYPYTQECITHILTKNFHLPFLNFFSEYYLNIDTEIFSDSDQNPLKDLFHMFKMKIDLDDKEFKQYLVTELDNLTDKSKADKAIHQSIQNWIDAKPFPYMKNIEYLTEIFSKKLSISKDELKQYFLVAKLINNSELSKEIIFDKNTNFVSTGQFEELVEEYCEPQYSDISRLAFKLFKLSDIETEKTEESEKEFNVIFKKINEQGYSVENMPYIAWSKARYHAQKKEFKEATDYYVLALENGKNSMGKHYIDIAKEGLIVSAHTTRKDKLDLKNAKSPFVKFHKEAYFLKLIDSLPDEINQYFLNDMKKKFSTYFTKLYPDIKTTKGEFNAHEHSIIYIPDIESIKLDLKKPDKWIKHKYPNPMTQLMHAAYWVRYGDVKQLIDGGANANEMRFNDNATALTMVLSNEFTGEKRDDAIKIAKLLISKMSEEALCAKLPKKKMTALGLAIDSGYVEIAKQLIEKGADINQTITPVNMSPLYYTVNKIGESKMDSSTFVNKMQFTNDSEILKIVNSMPSTVPFLNNAITDQEKIEAFKKLQRHVDSTPRNREMGDEASHFIMEEIRRHIKEYNQIFELLLNAHPNLELRFKGNLNTVLMLATELNEVELVKKLLDAGADKNATIKSHLQITKNNPQFKLN